MAASGSGDGGFNPDAVCEADGEEFSFNFDDEDGEKKNNTFELADAFTFGSETGAFGEDTAGGLRGGEFTFGPESAAGGGGSDAPFSFGESDFGSTFAAEAGPEGDFQWGQGEGDSRAAAGAGGDVFAPAAALSASAGGDADAGPGGAAENDGEEEVVAGADSTAEFAPVVQLQKVETDSGEKDENVQFKQRCALYRFSPDADEWKERGKGDVKLLAHKETGLVRMVLREEKTLKLRMNQRVNPAVGLEVHNGNEKAWTWTARDYSEEEGRDDTFAIRFRNAAAASLFREQYELARQANADADADADADAGDVVAAGKSATAESSAAAVGAVDVASGVPEEAEPALENAFAKLQTKGNWECQECYVSNPAGSAACAACESANPAAPAAAAVADVTLGAGEGGGEFTFGAEPDEGGSAADAFTFGSETGAFGEDTAGGLQGGGFGGGGAGVFGGAGAAGGNNAFGGGGAGGGFGGGDIFGGGGAGAGAFGNAGNNAGGFGGGAGGFGGGGAAGGGFGAGNNAGGGFGGGADAFGAAAGGFGGGFGGAAAGGNNAFGGGAGAGAGGFGGGNDIFGAGGASGFGGGNAGGAGAFGSPNNNQNNIFGANNNNPFGLGNSYRADYGMHAAVKPSAVEHIYCVDKMRQKHHGVLLHTTQEVVSLCTGHSRTAAGDEPHRESLEQFKERCEALQGKHHVVEHQNTCPGWEMLKRAEGKMEHNISGSVTVGEGIPFATASEAYASWCLTGGQAPSWTKDESRRRLLQAAWSCAEGSYNFKALKKYELLSRRFGGFGGLRGGVHWTLHQAEDVCILSFRGTSNVSEMLVDVKFSLTKHPGGGRVHRGFQQALDSIPDALAQAAKAAAQQPLVLTGHSLGGALATLAAAQLHLKHPELDLQVLTFGQPSVGDEEFAQWYHSTDLASRHTRFVSLIDPVQHVPHGLGGLLHRAVQAKPTQVASAYRHVGRRHCLNKKGWLKGVHVLDRLVSALKSENKTKALASVLNHHSTVEYDLLLTPFFQRATTSLKNIASLMAAPSREAISKASSPKAVESGVSNLLVESPTKSAISKVFGGSSVLGLVNMGLGVVNACIGGINLYQTVKVRKELKNGIAEIKSDMTEGFDAVQRTMHSGITEINDSLAEIKSDVTQGITEINGNLAGIQSDMTQGFDVIQRTMEQQGRQLRVLLDGQKLTANLVHQLTLEVRNGVQQVIEEVKTSAAQRRAEEFRSAWSSLLFQYRQLDLKPMKKDVSKLQHAAEQLLHFAEGRLPSMAGPPERLPYISAFCFASRAVADAHDIQGLGIESSLSEDSSTSQVLQWIREHPNENVKHWEEAFAKEDYAGKDLLKITEDDLTYMQDKYGLKRKCVSHMRQAITAAKAVSGRAHINEVLARAVKLVGEEISKCFRSASLFGLVTDFQSRTILGQYLSLHRGLRAGIQLSRQQKTLACEEERVAAAVSDMLQSVGCVLAASGGSPSYSTFVENNWRTLVEIAEPGMYSSLSVSLCAMEGEALPNLPADVTTLDQDIPHLVSFLHGNPAAVAGIPLPSLAKVLGRLQGNLDLLLALLSSDNERCWGDKVSALRIVRDVPIAEKDFEQEEFPTLVVVAHRRGLHLVEAIRQHLGPLVATAALQRLVGNLDQETIEEVVESVDFWLPKHHKAMLAQKHTDLSLRLGLTREHFEQQRKLKRETLQSLFEAKGWQLCSWSSNTKITLPKTACDEDLNVLSKIVKKFEIPLQHLNLNDCDKITDAGLEFLSQLPLQHLDLYRCNKITDAGLQCLSQLPLQHLTLYRCNKITDAGLQCLSQLPLQRLDLFCCDKITDAGLQCLSQLPLQHLNLNSCNKITDAGMEFLSQLPLQHLHLRRCDKITDAGLQFLSQLPLQHLSLRYCNKITDAGLQCLSQLPLQHLDLFYCKKITDAGLQFLSQLPLQHLDLGCCNKITDAGLQCLSQLPLQHLDLGSCNKITDAGLQCLSQLPLQHLDLGSCNKITDAGLQCLSQLPLRDLRLISCDKITDAGLRHLKQKLPDLITYNRSDWGF